MRIPQLVSDERREAHQDKGRLVALVGAVVLVGSPYLPWAYGDDALDDMTYLGGPSPTQFLGLALGVLLAVSLLAPRLLRTVLTGRRRRWFIRSRSLQQSGMCMSGARAGASSGEGGQIFFGWSRLARTGDSVSDCRAHQSKGRSRVLSLGRRVCGLRVLPSGGASSLTHFYSHTSSPMPLHVA